MQFLRLLEKQNTLYFPVLFELFGNSKLENTHLITYTVLEAQFWSVKWTTVTIGYANISSNISFLPIQTTQAKTQDAQHKSKEVKH